ncbi:MAG TPA: DUF1579 domain-containing protein [Phycisphaerales bacterium]|nr:DUF1579 domain-containing protein [Phycisphaerales bacterium]
MSQANAGHQALFRRLIGRWEGVCRTWIRPEELADESSVAGTFAAVLDGRFIRHVYEGSMQGEPRRGEELIGFNTVTRAYQSSWVDGFHMNYAIMFSQGEGAKDGFWVLGEYDVGEGQPRWGWRTEYALLDDDRLIITAFNIEPGGKEARAVETGYRRVK